MCGITSRDEQALNAAKLYYEQGLSQQEIAGVMRLSRPTVAKLLGYARDKRYVVIEVRDPRSDNKQQRRALLEAFKNHGVRHVRIAQTLYRDHDHITGELGRIGARLLEELVDDGYRVGVSWGRTMNAVARALEKTPRRGVEIIQLKGGLGSSPNVTTDLETINRLCKAFDAYARTLPLPVIFDSIETKTIVEKDRHIKNMLRLGRETDIVMFTVGVATREGIPLALGELPERDVELLMKSAVGDVCSRYFTEKGTIAVPSINDRTVGITLKQLAKRPIRILVAGGLAKTQSIYTALEMGLATHLVIDDLTADHVLRLHDECGCGTPRVPSGGARR